MRPTVPLFAAAAALGLWSCSARPERSLVSEKVPVRVLTASYETLEDVLAAPGTVQARHRTVLASQLAGFVRQVHVRAGDRVRAGQVLATLDAREPESRRAAAGAAIDEARAGLDEARHAATAASSFESAARASIELARATYSRYEKLGQARSVSPQELDEVRSRRDGAAAELEARRASSASAESRVRQIEARLAGAEAEARRAEVAVGWSVIRAPEAGRVSERSVDPGTAVFPATPLLVVESEAGPQVVATVPAARAERLASGLEVRMRKSGWRAEVRGRIAEIVPRSSAGHTIEFKIDLPTAPAAMPGDFVTVEVRAGTRRALLLPRRALREMGQLTGVFVVDSASRAGFRLVKAVGYDAERVEVVSGLEAGERVVREVGERLSDGAGVEIRP